MFQTRKIKLNVTNNNLDTKEIANTKNAVMKHEPHLLTDSWWQAAFFICKILTKKTEILPIISLRYFFDFPDDPDGY